VPNLSILAFEKLRNCGDLFAAVHGLPLKFFVTADELRKVPYQLRRAQETADDSIR
jgi:hypothetical protein